MHYSLTSGNYLAYGQNVDLLEQSIADHRCGKGGEGLMEVCAAVPAAASKGRFSKTNYTDCVGS